VPSSIKSSDISAKSADSQAQTTTKKKPAPPQDHLLFEVNPSPKGAARDNRYEQQMADYQKESLYNILQATNQ